MMWVRIPQLAVFVIATVLHPLVSAAQTAAESLEAAAAGGDQIKQAAKVTAGQDPLAMTSLWQLTLGMLLVLGLIVGIAWVLKRTGRFQLAAGGGLRILGGLSMGARERVVLLQVGDTQLLVGVAPGRVQTLHVLDQPLRGAPDNAAAGKGFAEQLGRFLKKEKVT
jgi:flagellar protein FliO/FliZ